MDRAALDVAIELGLRVTGWCPRGRRAEDGPIPARYPLRETPTRDYPKRTRLNVSSADATLILGAQPLRGGTALTARIALDMGRPCLIVDPSDPEWLAAARLWLRRIDPTILNVAGPRESEQPGVHECATSFLRALFGP